MNGKRLILFGAGAEGIKSLGRIGEERIAFFVDNNIDLQGSHIQSIKVLSLEELLKISKKEEIRIIISSQKYYFDILNQLHEAGINDAISVSRFLVEDAFKKTGKDRRILLMNTHAGINIGDQLISEGELEFFKKYFPHITVIEFPADLICEELPEIKKYVLKDDVIAVSGGGYMGSLWMQYGEENVRSIVRAFPDNRIIVMPQSVFFEDSAEGKKEYQNSANIYSDHRKIYFCAREKRTFNTIVEMLEKKDNMFLIPDMAFLLKSEKSYLRDKVGICLRSDKEKTLSEASIEQLYGFIESETIQIDMLADNYIGIHDRKRVVDTMIAKVSRLKYVITDRLHCMILCAITGTPCIAFDNLTGKVSGVYEWIKSFEYIHVIKDVGTAVDLINGYENESSIYKYDNSDLICRYKKLATVYEEFFRQ